MSPLPPRPAGPLARHFLAEYYGCDPARLDDPAVVEAWVRGAAAAARTTLLQVVMHRFAPQGVSGVAILAESHLAIPPGPEHGFASIELYVCGAGGDPAAGDAWLRRELAPAHVELRALERGDPALLARYAMRAPSA